MDVVNIISYQKEEKQKGANLFRFEEIFGIIQEHLFHTGIEDDTAHRPLMARIGPVPRSMRIGKIYLNSMNSFGLVLFLGLED
jgi:hypothetical protein